MDADIPRTVLDACVLFPPTLRHMLLYSAAKGLIRPVWSEEILEELRRNLAQRIPMPEDKAMAWITKMRIAFPDASVPVDPRRIATLTNHPKDRHVLAAAIAARAGIIVTLNLKDFPALALQPHGVEVWSPDDLLLRLLRQNEAGVMDALHTFSAAQKHPPRTISQIARQLGKAGAPRFSQAINTLVTPIGNR